MSLEQFKNDMDERAMVTFTPAKLMRFKAAYENAKLLQSQGGSDTFSFEGNPFFIGYAKYLIEYLETRMR